MKQKKPIQECCYQCERRHPLCWNDCPDYAERKADDAKKREALKVPEAEMYAIAASVKIRERKRKRK